jgi:cellulose synthase/poly-beta-1,6-N-acetylglucosamine synthase-like glycosyltransferase
MKLGRRRLKNLLIFPESQVRYGLLFLTLATFTHVALTIAALKVYSGWVTSEEDPAIPVWALIVGLFLIYFILQAFAFTLGLLMSHKIFGPLVPIRKLVSEMKAGQVPEPVKLRKNDEPMLVELADDLNSLAAKLSKR